MNAAFAHLVLRPLRLDPLGGQPLERRIHVVGAARLLGS